MPWWRSTHWCFVNQIRHGRFAEDDWYLQAIIRYGYHGITGSVLAPAHRRPIGAIRELWPLFRDRPVGVVLYGLSYWLFGLHLSVYMVLSEGVWPPACVLVYVLLRQLDLDYAPAALVASLVPSGDAVRFWAEGAQSEPAMPAIAMLVIAGASLLVWVTQGRDTKLRSALSPWLAIAFGGLV